ncbi:MAG: glycosyltransferase [Actinomycetota bacterium]
MKVAIVHDFLNQRGGAERVALSMTRLFPDAPLFTSLYDPPATFDEFDSVDVRTSFMQKLPHSEKTFRAMLPLYPLAFKSFDLSDFDLVVTSSTHYAHHVRPGNAHHVVYCHNPPRWLYQTDDYVSKGGPVPRWARTPLKPVLAYLRRLDQKAAARPSAYVANSKVTAKRIRALYGREAKVVSPPIDVTRFDGMQEGGEKKHYLVVSRLLPYKRVDLAVSVCTERKVPLVVVGEGPARTELEKIAGPNVRFAGRVSDEDLLELFSGAWALIHCGEEDFGLTPLEANAAGIPCVAFRNAGALETVIENETGILIPNQGGHELNEALDRIESRDWDPAVLKRHASTFDEPTFHRGLLRAIDLSLDSPTATPTPKGGQA